MLASSPAPRRRALLALPALLLLQACDCGPGGSGNGGPGPIDTTVTCDSATEVEYLGHCYYLDGSGGDCDAGYTLGPQSVLYTIGSWFEGRNYKHNVSNNCCIYNSESDQDFGMADHCNSWGPFTATDVWPGAAGCSDIYPPLLNTAQLTLCMSL